MFRPMRRSRQQISHEECVEVLASAPRGVLALQGDDGYPYAVPVDFLYDGEAGCIYFHGAKEGHKVDAVRRCPKASFCVMDEGFRREGEWALNIRSVIAFGRIRFIEDPEATVEIARRIGEKYFPDPAQAAADAAASAPRLLCLALKIEHMTGKLVNES